MNSQNAEGNRSSHDGGVRKGIGMKKMPVGLAAALIGGAVAFASPAGATPRVPAPQCAGFGPGRQRRGR